MVVSVIMRIATSKCTVFVQTTIVDITHMLLERNTNLQFTVCKEQIVCFSLYVSDAFLHHSCKYAESNGHLSYCHWLKQKLRELVIHRS